MSHPAPRREPSRSLVWGGQFPGSSSFEPRLYIAHVFIIPALLATLIGTHLAIIMRQKHSQFPGPGRREDNVVGTPMWPGYALRSLGLLFAVAGVLFLLGGLIQINPIWQYGPYEPWLGTNGAQPDWYLGWLIGALRLMPPLEIHVFGHTVSPTRSSAASFSPASSSRALRMARARAAHHAGPARATTCSTGHATTRGGPRPAPPSSRSWSSCSRRARPTGCSSCSPYSYEGAIWFFRIAFFVVPGIVYMLTKRICAQLARKDSHPLRGWSGAIVQRNARGGFDSRAACSHCRSGTTGVQAERHRRALRSREISAGCCQPGL